MASVSFPKWPTWNQHFPEKDVKRIAAVTYWPVEGNEQLTLSDEGYRLAIGRNGVSGLVLLDKHSLPPTRDRRDAVTVEYEV